MKIEYSTINDVYELMIEQPMNVNAMIKIFSMKFELFNYKSFSKKIDSFTCYRLLSKTIVVYSVPLRYTQFYVTMAHFVDSTSI